MRRYLIDGAEIPYALDAIRSIDPDLVGYATLFSRRGKRITASQVSGRIRERLLADYEGRGGEALPQLIMYSGSRTE
jgi:hypothetical protein